MKVLETLKKKILADGVIDASEVNEIETVLYADGSIDKEEADFLFELNDAVTDKNNHASWEALFVKAIAGFVLDDDDSNGEIDSEEEAYLLYKLQGDGQIDKTEKALLKYLKREVKELPESLAKLLK